MKILHFADAHLGSDDSGPVDPQTGLSARLSDFLRSMDRIVEYVEEDGVDVVLFCGDAFKTRTPTPTLVREFATRIHRMSVMAPVVLIVGNHDLPGALGRAHTLEIYRALAVRDVFVVARPSTLAIQCASGPLQVVVIPWPSRHNVMAQEKLQGVPVEEINKLVADAISNRIRELAVELDPDTPAILAGHLSVAGGSFGSERAVMLGSDVVIPLEAVGLPQFDYVALGHLHRHQVLQDGPAVVYCGSIERIDFGEEKEDKGFVVATIGRDLPLFGDAAGTEVEFVPLAVRDFVTIRVSVDGSDPTAAVIEAIGRQDINGKVIRLSIEATAEADALLDESQIQKALSGALKIASISKQVERPIRTRLGDADYHEMGPLDLLGAYLDSKGTPTEERDALISAAQELIREGE